MVWSRTRQRHRAAFLLLLLIAVAALALTPRGVQAAAPNLSLHMVGEAPLTNGATPVLVAGIWHEIDVNLTAVPAQIVTLWAVLAGSSPAGPANTYEWSYDPVTGAWTDVLYGQFIQPGLSTAVSAQIAFVVGTDAAATEGVWQLSASVGSVTVASEDIEVQGPQVSYGLSSPDITFRVDPFQNAQATTAGTSQYLGTINQGNVPLGMQVTFDTLGSALSLANPANVTHVGSDAQYYLALSLGSLPPQVITVTGRTNVTPLQVVPSSGAARITATVQQTFAVTVTVGRSGYSVHTMGNVVFETLNSISVTYGSITTWQVYLTGAQNVTLSVAMSGVRLVSASLGGTALAFPATLSLAPDAETTITLQIRADAVVPASVTFAIQLLGTGDSQTFTTQVSVTGGSGNTEGGAVTLLWIVGAALVAAVFGFVSFDTLRVRRRAKQAADEKTRKRGYNARRMDRTRRQSGNHGNDAKRKARSNGAGQGRHSTAPAKGDRQ